MIFNRYSNTSLVVTGLGLIATIGIAILFNYSRSTMYHELSSADSLNYLVESIEKDRGVAFVTFEGNKKYEITWAKNLQYEDFPSLSSLISPGDLILKRAFSDTVRVKHLDKEYVYVL